MFNKIKERKRDMETLSSTITSAMTFASGDDSETAGAHHLLFAALAMEESSGRQAFETIGANPDGLRDAIEAALKSAAAIELPDLNNEPVPPGPGQMKVDATFEAAIKATHSFHNDAGGPLLAAHFVAGVASIKCGLSARALGEMDIDAAELVTTATAVGNSRA